MPTRVTRSNNATLLLGAAHQPCCRWLLNLDGHTAAYRLAQLLAVNSLVLKQQSPRREYFYRRVRQRVRACSTTLH